MKKSICCLLVVCLLAACLLAGGCSTQKSAAVTVADITWSGDHQPKPGATVEFCVELQNNGSAALKKGTALDVALYVDNQKVFTETYDDGLAVGKSAQVKFPQWKAVLGEHVITAVLGDVAPTREIWSDKQHDAANIRVAEEALEVPAIAQKFGMTNLTFSDDFTTLDLVDKECTGAYGYKWYANIPYGAMDADPDEYELTEDGVCLKRKPTHFCWTLCTMDCNSGAGWSYRHGYLEMRLRFAPNRVIEGSDGKPSIWALPPEKIMSFSGANRYVETDFLEVFDDDDTLFTTTVHDLQFTDDNQTEYIHHYRNSNNKHLGLRDGEWHTMGFIRREGVMQCFLDGQEYMALHWGDNKKSYPDADIVKGTKDGTDAFSIADDQLIPLIISGNEGWPLEIDYITVWEGDETAGLGESTETAQFVDLYLRGGDGQVNLTVNFDNYETLSEMDEVFAELPAEQKEELDRLAKREVGKTLTQVVNDAKQFKEDMDLFVATYAADSEGAILTAESLEACETIVKGESQWNTMSAELKEAINNYVFLSSNGNGTYDDLLAAARKKITA